MADGSRHTLEGDLVTIGRQASCSIVIADSNISRVHARLRAVDNGWTIEDLGSTNGTKVDGELIIEPTLLSHGQLIALGTLQLHFEQA
jgi:pSer/pThr/pTyr-binding forkhead associated (FHA) protein